ncbi:MAG: fold metallo-hydrolase [Streptosporangiaceae bacterium]|nr:fold metallo-hydrolase [Streptosporangiaceae bacterium]
MRLTVIGCSGSLPGPNSPASCYLVEAEGFSLLIDLGSGAIGPLQRYQDLHAIDAVCISHLHADHCLDLCGYWIVRKYYPRPGQTRVPVHGPSGTAEHLARAYGLDADPGMRETFDFQDLRQETWQLGPFRVTTALMNHPVETYGFRIEHGGRVLAYSGDTGDCDALVDLARDADVFLCESCWFEGPDLPEDMHLTGRTAGEHAARAGARKLVLTHLLPWNDSVRTLAEAKASGFQGDIEVARQGAVYDLA